VWSGLQNLLVHEATTNVIQFTTQNTSESLFSHVLRVKYPSTLILIGAITISRTCLHWQLEVVAEIHSQTDESDYEPQQQES
jgi:hypothetical protein